MRSSSPRRPVRSGWSRARRNRVLLSLFAVAGAAFLLAGPVFGQPGVDPEGEIQEAQCYGHHYQEGFRSVDLFPLTVSQVKRGDVFAFNLTIVNPWLHEILNPTAFVDISGIPGARFPGGEEPEFTEASGTLAPREAGNQEIPGGAAGASTATATFNVGANATSLEVALVGDPGATGRNVWQLTLVSPDGLTHETEVPSFTASTTGEGPYNEHVIALPYDAVSEGGSGEWAAHVTYVRGSEPQAAWELEAGVFYDLAESKELFVRGPDKLEPREDHTFTFEIMMPDEPHPEAALVYGAKVIAHHKHNDANAEDFGNYTKWNTLVFPVGEQTVVGQSSVILAAPDAGPLLRAYGQILGFSATFLLLPALFLGGTFGRGSVTWFNKIMGGARRRVLWHNSSSYLLLIVSVVHMLIFLVENFWHWSHGAFWGGLSLAAMISLALTGAFQRRFVTTWGFARWRFVHFTLGMFVVGFVLVHVLADGSHLDPLRQAVFGE